MLTDIRKDSPYGKINVYNEYITNKLSSIEELLKIQNKKEIKYSENIDYRLYFSLIIGLLVINLIVK